MYNSIFHVFVSSNSQGSQFDLHISHKKTESMKSRKNIGPYWGWCFKTAEIEFT